MTERFWQDMNDDIQRFTEARVQVLEERIAKAREILNRWIEESDGQSRLGYVLPRRALDALEGK